MQVSRGGADPKMGEMPLLLLVMRGIKRLQACNGANKPRPRLPITKQTMRLLKASWETLGLSLDRTMLGFLRSGEATVPSREAYDPSVHLSIADVAINTLAAPRVIAIRIKVSKTDPFRQGTTIYLGKTGVDLCPVSTLLGYISHRGLSSGPLFRFQDGSPLTRAALVRELRLALSTTGLVPTAYAGHSFRIGTATSAAAAGVEDVVIKSLGRWQSTAYQRYVRLSRSELVDITAKLAQ